MIFGYICAPKGNSLSDETIDSTLSNIGIRGVTDRIRGGSTGQIAVELGKPVSVTEQSRADGLAIARGSVAGNNGNAEFPFEFVIRYHEDGDKFES